MPFRCSACGLSFNAADEFMKHKLAHQKEAEKPEKRGLICLNCGESIRTDPYGADYTGDVICPNCNQLLKVVIRDGEVAMNMAKGAAPQTGDDLMLQYRKWVLEYMKAKDLIDSLVPVPANLSAGAEIKPFRVTEDMLAQFRYAGSLLIDALNKRQDIHEKMKRQQQGR